MSTLIMSDSHGDTDVLLDIINNNRENIENVIFLGDGEKDIQRMEYLFRDIKFYCVSGNNDPEHIYPLEQVVEIDGIKIYMCHSHHITVQNRALYIAQLAKDAGAVLALYGHTHVPTHKYLMDVDVVNPGSVKSPRQKKTKSYAILKVVNGEPVITFWDAETHEYVLVEKTKEYGGLF